MHWRAPALLLLLALLVAVGYTLTPRGGVERLVIYADRTLQAPLEELASGYIEYMRREGVNVNITFVLGSSGYVLSQLKLHGFGDLYVSDDRHFALIGVREGILDNESYREIGYIRLALLVEKGNPLGVKSLRDALDRGLVIAVGNPEHVSAGVLADRVFREAGLSSLVQRLIREGKIVYVDSAAQAASRVLMGTADAAITFNIYTRLYPDGLEEVHDPLLASVRAPVVVAVPASHGEYSWSLYSYVLEHVDVFYKYGVEPP